MIGTWNTLSGYVSVGAACSLIADNAAMENHSTPCFDTKRDAVPVLFPAFDRKLVIIATISTACVTLYVSV
jgi:hypothetical protein